MPHAAIIADPRAARRERMVGDPTVVVVQAPTSFNFSHPPGAAGRGSLENADGRGFGAHRSLAVSTAGVPLGVLKQQGWARLDSATGTGAQEHERAVEDQDSYQWVAGLPTAAEVGAGSRLISVGDRESPLSEVLDEVLKRDLDFMVRAMAGRSLTQAGEDSVARIRQQPAQPRYSRSLQRRPDRATRAAQVELRLVSVIVRRPARSTCQGAPLSGQGIEVLETDPPAGEAAVQWRFLTS